jgi:hypothetical protein
MNRQAVSTNRRTRSQRPDAREQAALRRVAAQMQAEAAELPPTTWVAERLHLQVDEWGERVLPELALLMAIDRRQEWAQSWMRRRPEGCPLTMEEEACLRRVAALLRAEAAELGSESPVGARLDSWGIQLALDCEHPNGLGLT